MDEVVRSSEEITYITTFNSGSACIRAVQVRDDHIHVCQFRNNFLVWLHSAEEVGTRGRPYQVVDSGQGVLLPLIRSTHVNHEVGPSRATLDAASPAPWQNLNNNFKK